MVGSSLHVAMSASAAVTRLDTAMDRRSAWVAASETASTLLESTTMLHTSTPIITLRQWAGLCNYADSAARHPQAQARDVTVNLRVTHLRAKRNVHRNAICADSMPDKGSRHRVRCISGRSLRSPAQLRLCCPCFVDSRCLLGMLSALAPRSVRLRACASSCDGMCGVVDTNGRRLLRPVRRMSISSLTCLGNASYLLSPSPQACDPSDHPRPMPASPPSG